MIGTGILFQPCNCWLIGIVYKDVLAFLFFKVHNQEVSSSGSVVRRVKDSRLDASSDTTISSTSIGLLVPPNTVTACATLASDSSFEWWVAVFNIIYWRQFKSKSKCPRIQKTKSCWHTTKAALRATTNEDEQPLSTMAKDGPIIPFKEQQKDPFILFSRRLVKRDLKLAICCFIILAERGIEI